MPFGMRHVALTENWVAKDLSDMKFRNLVISGPLHSLERLDLHSFGRITVFGLSHLRLVPSLRAITLGTPRVPYQDYALAFSCMTQLTELNIERARLSKNDACAIATLSGLRRLELAECTWVNPDSVCRLASLASHLESLSLQGCSSITVEPLGTLSQLTRLTSLDLSGCTSVGEGVSEMLSGLSDLRTCALRCCHLTDECMAALGALTCLR